MPLKPVMGWLISLTILIVGLPGCSLPGLGQDNAEKPSAAISSPTANQTLEVGQETQVQSVSVDAEGVIKVELVVDGQVVWIDANADPQPNTPFIVQQPWTPETAGAHTIVVRAYNQANITGESTPLTVTAVDSAVAQVDPEEGTPSANQEDSLTLSTTATPTPTDPPQPSPTPQPEATQSLPTPTEPAPTPTITSTPTPTPPPQDYDPTGLEPDGRFREIWLELGAGDSRLGYPTAPAITDRNYAKQYFENGVMYWWDNPDDPDYIWAIDTPADDLKSGATSNRYPDTWDGDDEYSCEVARQGGPVRGFGKVWCDYPELQPRLGYPIEPERGSGGNPPFSMVQFFQGGVMLYNPANAEVFVLFEQGDWQRFIY